MRRRRLIEFHEQPWFPEELRVTVTSLLGFLLNCVQYHRAVAPLLTTALHQTGEHRVIDLCAGSGGPWPELVSLVGKNEPLAVSLTDKFPTAQIHPHLEWG